MATRLLVTGRPGCGKTTLVKALLKRFPNRFCGFYTEEVREGDLRSGFTVADVRGLQRLLFASVSFSKAKKRVSKYGVDVAAFETVALKEMERSLEEKTPLVIDEIGKMELFSERFRNLLEQVFSSPLFVVATVHSHPHPFTDALKRRSDVELLFLDRSNFDETLSKLTFCTASFFERRKQKGFEAGEEIKTSLKG
ncbi:MAG: nucleoside-triphosphatase [Planctomycetota bacterium]|nr:nucleoside-triphosphatase [Planctomycetota bacterium]